MHVELQVALNFLISFLYNKLPRRRVNQFGEELDQALRNKFDGHWYPEKPFKGSAFRCVKTTPPLDPVFETAARESGMDLHDIQENLPQELSIWIDPGEVSYRLGEKGPVKVLYSESDTIEERTDREVTRTFNPEAQCFKPIDSIASQLGALNIDGSSSGNSGSNSANGNCSTGNGRSNNANGACSGGSSPFGGNSPSPTSAYKSSSPINAFIAKSSAPLTFTTATFAQTKFGSTKLKTSSKRSQRMSPTEFSNYIKQRALAQQVAQQQLAAAAAASAAAAAAPVSPAAIFDGSAQAAPPPQRPRSLSPHPPLDPTGFLILAASTGQQQQTQNQPVVAQQQFVQNPFTPATSTAAMFDGYLGDVFTNTSAQQQQGAPLPSTGKGQQRQSGSSRFSAFFFDKSFSAASNGSATSAVTSNGITSMGTSATLTDSSGKNFSSLDGFGALNLNAAVPYPNQMQQHLLVAN